MTRCFLVASVLISLLLGFVPQVVHAQGFEDFAVPNPDDPSWCNSAYAEGANDYSGDPMTPTSLFLCEGVNTITGSVQAPGDVRDFFSIQTVLSPQHQLDAVYLIEYVDGDTGASGNKGFIQLDLADPATNGTELPTRDSVGGFLGTAHLDQETFPADENMLTLLAQAPLGGTGFGSLPPINENVLVFNVQQTGPQLTNYTLEFHVSVVPEPSSISGWWVVSIVAGLWRRRTR